MKLQYLVFLTSFLIVLLSIPALIRVALLKRLFDEPDDVRKLHGRRVPSVGGVLIFAGTLFAYSLWFPIRDIHEYEELLNAADDRKYIISGMLILFFVGVKDDIIGTAPIKKLVAHVIVGLMLILMAEIKITSLHGLFGVLDIPLWAQIFLSLFTYIVVVNSFNLIDGIDGLAGGVGLIASLSFGAWFVLAGDPIMATLSFSLAGSLLAFLIFNFQPAKIFMGDSGSLVIGMIICVLAIQMIEFPEPKIEASKNPVLKEISRPLLAMAVLAYPLLDTLRVFILRAIKGVSPFSADRNHIHHRLLDNGLTHRVAVISIYLANLTVIATAYFVRTLSTSMSFIILFVTTLLIAQLPFIFKKKKNIQEKTTEATSSPLINDQTS